jgi:ABC-type bacteriocin/lantibiotic exporter with double-glycine peptidase domain
MLLLKNREFHTRYYNWLTNLLDVEKKIKFHEIDWNKPWWQVYGWNKLNSIYAFVCIAIESAFLTTLPITLVFLIQNPNPTYYLSMGFTVLIFSSIFAFSYILTLVKQCTIMNNITHSANSYFLTIDPRYHTMKNSGQIISKIERASGSFLDFDIALILEIFPNFVGVLVGVFSLFWYNTMLGMIGSIGCLVIFLVGVYLRIFNNIVFRQKVIDTEDKSKSLTVENLSQIAYIRSTFATTEQNQKSEKYNKDSAAIRLLFWTTSPFTDMSLFFVQIILALGIGYYMSNLIRFEGYNLVTGIAAFTSYLGGTSRIINLGSKIKRIIESEYKIRDLFNFVRDFGQQTYPVLDENHSQIKN